MSPLSAVGPLANPAMRAEVQAPLGAPGGAFPVGDLEKLATQTGAGAAPSAEIGGSFSTFLGQMVREVSAQQGASDAALNGLLTGQDVSLHQAMISVEEASVSFQLMVEVRNRLLDSYQELMRMQV